MLNVRERHPRHIPCLVHTPDGEKLKLLIGRDATASFVTGACRARMSSDTGSASTGYFLIHGRSMCMGTTRIASLDTNAPQPVELHLTCENTFG